MFGDECQNPMTFAMTGGSDMNRKAVALAAALILFSASAGHALPPAPIDLSYATATYTDAMGVVWTNLKGTSGVTQPAGTGVYDPFLRQIATGNGPHGDNGIEQGLNTDATVAEPLDNVGNDPHTHSVLMGSLGVVKVGGVDYFSFTLDLNEPAGGGGNFLSLDQVKIWTTPNAAGNMLASVGEVDAAGLLRYDMDAGSGGNQTVWLDYLNANTIRDNGSGVDDMEMLIPVSYFAGYAATDYMYFWAQFGAAGDVLSTTARANGRGTTTTTQSYYGEAGFEEWRYQQGTENVVPEPMSILMLGGGLAGFIAARKRKK
ncbi:MAG: PEP-CTERM sorting domain-containing protein [Candidatus Eisenbacteria bacterium]